MSWSEWLDFNGAGVETVPEAPGVYLLHASMKVLHIGGSDNMRRSLVELLSDPCAGTAKRFHYMPTSSYAQVKEQLLKEYAEKHAGKMPPCMEK
jgi:hypothetical protein